jgi:hypothetical protein
MNTGRTGQSVNGSVLDLVRTSVAPRLFQTAPPNYYTQTSFTKDISLNANFAVDDSGLAASTAERVPTQTGLVIWQTNRGAASVYRYGIVPQGATVVSSEVGGGNERTRGFYLGGNWQGDEYRLTWQNSVAVPYNSIVNQDTIKLSPDLAQSFSAVRVYAGDIRMVCDTVPIGNTALNGYFSIGSFSDLRDVSQVSESGAVQAVQNAYSPPDLVQSSVTSKEGIKEISAMRGVVALVGSDIQPFFMSPNVDEDDVYDAGFTTYFINGVANGAGSTTYTGIAAADVTGARKHYFAKSWFSPWGTTVAAVAATNNPAGQIGYENFAVDTINPTGVLDFELDFRFRGNQEVNDVDIEVIACFTHIFVTCSTTNYACTYNTEIEEFKYRVPKNRVAYVEHFCCKSYPKMKQTSFTKPQPAAQNMHALTGNSGQACRSGGMYLGTSCVIYAYNATGGAALPATDAANFGTSINSIAMRVRARSIYGMGELGPSRVIRWDSMSNGQSINFSGFIRCQCIPEGNIAPFVQKQAMFSDTCHNMNSIPALAEIYNGKGPIKRNWIGDHYDAYIRTQLPDLDEEQIRKWVNPKLMSLLVSAGGSFGAGFWSDLYDGFKKVTDIVSAVPGQWGEAAKNLRTGVDSLVNVGESAWDAYNRYANSGGQFGQRRARRGYGQFGSEGQFGAAGGFRRRRRRAPSAASSRRRVAPLHHPLMLTYRKRAMRSGGSSRASSRRSRASSKRSRASSKRSKRSGSRRSASSRRSRSRSATGFSAAGSHRSASSRRSRSGSRRSGSSHRRRTSTLTGGRRPGAKKAMRRR